MISGSVSAIFPVEQLNNIDAIRSYGNLKNQMRYLFAP